MNDMIELLDNVLLEVSRATWDGIAMALAALTIINTLAMLAYLARRLTRQAVEPENDDA